MAKGKGEIKGWITRNGVHIPIYGNYSVRGGVEPKAKGSKFKGKKKPDKYTNPRTGKRDHVQGKTQAELNKALKEQGLELDGAYQRAANEEKVYMYDKDGNVYSGTFNKYSDGGREIVNIERDKLDGESNVRNLDPDRDEHIRNGESKGVKREEAIKKQENERFKTAKELKAEGKWDTSEKDKYADRDWNKDVDDAKRYGYSEQTEEGKKPVTKAEEKEVDTLDNTIDRKIKTKEDALKTLEAAHPGDSQNSKQWETYANMQNSLSRKFDLSKDELKSIGQESSKPDFSKMSYAEAGAYVAEHKKDFGLSEGADAYQAAYEMKKGTWEGKAPGQESSRTASNGAPRFSDDDARANREVEWDGQKYQLQPTIDWDRAKNEEYVAGHTYVPIDAKEGKSQFFVAQDGSVYNSGSEYLRQKNSKGQESSNPDFSKMSYSEAGKYVAEHKKDFGLSKDDDAYMAAYDIKNNGKKIGQRLLDNTTPEKEQRIKDNGWLGENGRLKRTEKSTKVGALPTTVSGLRSAYAEATGSEKAKISAELRRKGYTLVGGKWVKGK